MMGAGSPEAPRGLTRAAQGCRCLAAVLTLAVLAVSVSQLLWLPGNARLLHSRSWFAVDTSVDELPPLCEAVGQCKVKGDTYYEYGGKCYLLVKEKMRWPDAQVACRKRKMELVTMNSIAESLVLYGRFKDATPVHTGLSFGSGSWRWPQGAPANFTMFFRRTDGKSPPHGRSTAMALGWASRAAEVDFALKLGAVTSLATGVCGVFVLAVGGVVAQWALSVRGSSMLAGVAAADVCACLVMLAAAANSAVVFSMLKGYSSFLTSGGLQLVIACQFLFLACGGCLQRRSMSQAAGGCSVAPKEGKGAPEVPALSPGQEAVAVAV